MDYSLLLIKASQRKASKRLLDQEGAAEEEMMPAMVLMRNEKGEARLELRNSIVLRQSIKPIGQRPVSKVPSLKTDRKSSSKDGGTTNYKSAVDH
jgi:hypothetical protein